MTRWQAFRKSFIFGDLEQRRLSANRYDSWEKSNLNINCAYFLQEMLQEFCKIYGGTIKDWPNHAKAAGFRHIH
jgi:hypothetical protein